MTTTPSLYGHGDIARRLGVHLGTVYRWAAEPDWPAGAGKIGKIQFYRADDVRAWLEENRPMLVAAWDRGPDEE